MSAPVRPEITPWFIVHFQSEMVARAELAHETMRRTNLGLDDKIRSILASSIAQHLSALEESNNILRDKYPSSFKDLNRPFESDFKLWRGFRDDAAHPADRCFRVPETWHHDAQIPDARFGSAVDVLQYDYATDSLATGAWHCLLFPVALSRAREVAQHTYAAVVRAATVEGV